MGPRMRYKESIDEILSEPFDFDKVKPCVESKVFGIGVEAYTVGSAEFSLSYAAANPGQVHPPHGQRPLPPHRGGERQDPRPAGVLSRDRPPHHPPRPLGQPTTWSLFDDETREMAKEIVRCGGLDGRVKMALDYFDASVNRVAAWTLGFRNWQKALLKRPAHPQRQPEGRPGRRRLHRRAGSAGRAEGPCPFGAVWDEYCRRCGAPLDGTWLDTVRQYEKEVLSQR